MSMISNALITGGFFNQNIDQRQTQRSAIDRLQDAVAPTAFHNSGERFDPPKCHPNTRVAVLDKIDKWALRIDPETSYASILWLSGAAGAGKSAIAQTMAEHHHSKGLLIASFFFGRSDPTRNHARSLVSTIVSQLYSLLPPPEQSRILAAIDRDPLIFTKSLLTQFETLIVNPLRPLFENGYWTSINAPRVVIIDGLDECLDRDMQRNVLLMLSASVRQFHSPFIFLLASRPEHDIKAIFGSPDFLPIHTRLFLDDSYLPDADIELFLRDQFEECRTTHPFRHMIPPDWPSDETVKKIVHKSSGQFIYASVVAKYIKSSHHRPHHRLDVVLKLRPPSKDLPFAELDALYSHIFSAVDDIERVLNVISFYILVQDLGSSVDSFHIFPDNVYIYDIERILRQDAGDVAILLCDLASVIGYEEAFGHKVRLKILHASLVDYLLDCARSKEYFIDPTRRRAEHVADCFVFLSHVQYQGPSIYTVTAPTAMFYFELNHRFVVLTEPICNAIRGFSISRMLKSALSLGPVSERRFLFRQLVFRFLPALFQFLKKSDLSPYYELFQYHQSEYDLFLRETIKMFLPETLTSLLLALLTIHHELPIGAFHDGFGLSDGIHFGDEALAILHLDVIRGTDLGYLEYLSDFLRNPERSREFCAGPELFAQAAKHCLFYLCDHKMFAQQAPPRMSAQQCLRRKYTPWKWRRRVPREDISGSRVMLWLWLRRPNSFSRVSRHVFYRKSPDPIDFVEVYSPIGGNPFTEYSDPVVTYRSSSAKYRLALIYLNCFLPKAGKLDDLVDMCQRLTFASCYQDFPLKSARARSNMQIYAAKWQ